MFCHLRLGDDVAMGCPYEDHLHSSSAPVGSGLFYPPDVELGDLFNTVYIPTVVPTTAPMEVNSINPS